MPFRAPVSDYQFLFEHVVDLQKVIETDRFAEADKDVIDAILTEAGKMCEEVMYPVQRNGDLQGAVLENGVVRTSPGYAEAYGKVAEGGWISTSADPEYGGMGLPHTITTAVNEMMSASCLSLQLNPLMTQGQIEALEHHASDDIKAIYLPKLITGEWSGTMNLTEPQAGSDVGALRSKAEPNGDGSFAVTGQKIYISWGDNDFTGNVCHLVLARLPDGVPGTKGISLFIVPKFIPDENGEPGVANTLKVVSLEEKLGLHGSPTAVMQFDGATGWLVGEAHDGMRAMFTMMNNARLGVGCQGIGVAEGAYQHALAYAQDRTQGRSPIAGGTGTIIDHADVRRMLTTMKADTFAARSIAMACAVAIDMTTATGDKECKARAAFLTPIAKAFGTDTGIAVSEMGVQVHGGMGFIEETGAAQYARDVRVTAIYEGTNGIQAMDLVGRKLMDGGEAAYRLLDEIEANAEEARDTFPELAEPVWEATETLRETTEWLVSQTDMNDRFAGSVPFLKGFARVLGAHFHLRAAMGEGEYGARTKLARFYITRLLPEHGGLLAHAVRGAEDLYALSPEDLVA
ncbi:acyl-CoA dehydrogenase [Shimia thalassica]|uniref:acyl-CoA dehydrogenase n=1 Tax=Shimia thalassica TaxID=1715693 RepID=UPI0026E46D2E|nr:acyl-CoA dehydrogenase [Shimia thalassica]MDO6478562.1 acyl-CoA dehydrogenase [Shimia thalassica]MDP2493284.1 acyl-CoA dehydrogenase [Shimia thalassica]MDP2579217.1 acyl-CoA dehydrogenase [Shimia thalassica]